MRHFQDVPNDLVKSVRSPTLVVVMTQEDAHYPELTARLIEEFLS